MPTVPTAHGDLLATANEAAFAGTTADDDYLVLPPPVEPLVVAWLGSRPEVVNLTTDISADSVTDGLCVRLTRVGSGATDDIGWMDVARLQIDCFGAAGEFYDVARADLLARTVRAVLSPWLFCGQHPLGVVSNALTTGYRDLADTKYPTARAR